MLQPAQTYSDLVRAFRWEVPARFNIAAACCDRHAATKPEAVAILDVGPDFALSPLTFAQLRQRADHLAMAMAAAGVAAGDRVGLLLPQGPLVAIVHLATYKLGAIAVPLAALFGTDAIGYRLRDAGVRVLFANAPGWQKVRGLLPDCPDLMQVITVEDCGAPAVALDAFIAGREGVFPTRDTACDDPAMMIYTSGTTGPPKGALHGHRVLLGHLPGVQMTHGFLPQPDDRLWTPADWAWAGGLLNVLLPALYFGTTVVSRRHEKFIPEEGVEVMRRANVRNAFIPPTALRIMRGAGAVGADGLLRTLASAGEALGAETLEWGRAAFGVPINEFYGQTECNYIVGASAELGVYRAGSMGRPIPGHDVSVIDAEGRPVAEGEIGQIAVRRPDPAMFLGYWNQPEASAAKFIGDFMITGDQAELQDGGYFSFVGRDDDVITSAGFRIGPGEIEDCLLRHPAVGLAAVVGKPDPVRTEIIKAFIVLKPAFAPDPALQADIQAFVREHLSAHEYPREIAFIDEMPMTTTGKIIRRALRALG